MASLAEELELLSLPAPGKINLEEFEDDLTSARVISKDDIYEDERENKAINKSNLRKKAAILLAEQDTRYAGETISRKDLLKLRGDYLEDEQEQLDEGNSGSDSENESEQEFLTVIDENYEFDESWNDTNRSEDFEQDSENEGNEEIDDSKVEEDKNGEQEGGGEEDVNQEGGEVNKSEEEENWEEDEKQKGGKVNESEEEGDWEEDEEQEMKEVNESEEEGMQRFSHLDTDEIQKGKAVVHQIALWDSLLENRIRLQKMLVEVNKLPQNDAMSEIKEKGGSQIKDPLHNTQQLLTNLLHNLLFLQQTLYERNSDTAGILKKESKPESDEDIPSDDEDDREKEDKQVTNGKTEDDDDTLKLPRKRKQSMHFDDYSAHITKRHTAFEQFRDATIKKWNEKTRLASGKVSSKSFNSFDRSTLNQIKQILNDRERLIKRTQLKRSSYRVLGKTEDYKDKNSMEQRNVDLKDYDTEIFDDDDFYHQLLREFIERKSNVDPNDPIAMGRQWLEIQRLRSKVKRKVDTKASKGRRLRYDVHPKLVSFMAPQNRGTMVDSSRNELFSSLFGKRQPRESADISLFR